MSRNTRHAKGLPAHCRIAGTLCLLATIACSSQSQLNDDPPSDGGSNPAADSGQSQARQPDGWADGVRVPVAEDENPDPDIVEVTLEAVETELELESGVTTTAWSYNGMVPGPRIEAEVGDTLIVHFENSLPEETTIHWHGLELPSTMDGSLIAQPAVQPGETFTYEFKLLNPATYWYHPHIRSHVQVERGLYGPLVVEDPRDTEELGLPEDELVLVLDDILLGSDGQLAPPYPDNPIDRAQRQLNGREGDVLLTNGRELPAVQVRAGVPIRLRLVNAANARFFRVSVADHRFYRIGGDGGLLESPLVRDPVDLIKHSELEQMHQHGMGGAPSLGTDALVSNPDPDLGVMLVPGERADLVFTPTGDEGDTFFLEWHDFHRGQHTVTYDSGTASFNVGHGHADGEREPERLLKFEIVEGSASAAGEYVPPSALRTIEPIDTAGADKLPVRFGHAMPDGDGNVTFFATMAEGKGVPFEALTAEQALQARVGETYVYEVVNMTGGDHPFHPHGFFFQPIEIEYVDEENPDNNRVVPFEHLENKDSLRIPARPGGRGTSRTIARLAVHFDDAGREGMVEAFGKTPTETQSGGWLVHCHILEHANRGMMTFLNLRE